MTIKVTFTEGDKTVIMEAVTPAAAIGYAQYAVDKGSDACIITEDGVDYRVADYEAKQRA